MVQLRLAVAALAATVLLASPSAARAQSAPPSLASLEALLELQGDFCQLATSVLADVSQVDPTQAEMLLQEFYDVNSDAIEHLQDEILAMQVQSQNAQQLSNAQTAIANAQAAAGTGNVNIQVQMVQQQVMVNLQQFEGRAVDAFDACVAEMMAAADSSTPPPDLQDPTGDLDLARRVGGVLDLQSAFCELAAGVIADVAATDPARAAQLADRYTTQLSNAVAVGKDMARRARRDLRRAELLTQGSAEVQADLGADPSGLERALATFVAQSSFNIRTQEEAVDAAFSACVDTLRAAARR